MKRTKLKDRLLPDYTKGEEIFNMVSHIVGGAMGVIITVICLTRAFSNQNVYQIIGSFIFGLSMIILYVVSSIYHGLVHITAKKVFQIIDHCAIFILIAGTYTPIALCSIRESNPLIGWGLLIFVWGMAVLGVVLNAIDLKKYSVFSNICYILVGWCAVFVLKPAVEAVTLSGFLWLLAGGIAYTVGAVFYAIASKGGPRYSHSVFHLFVLLGSALQAVCIILYVLK